MKINVVANKIQAINAIVDFTRDAFVRPCSLKTAKKLVDTMVADQQFYEHAIRGLSLNQPPDFGWRAETVDEADRLHQLWAWHNGQGGWSPSGSAVQEGSD